MITETTIQIIGAVIIFLALALIVFTIAGGWRLSVKRKKVECWANLYAGFAVFHSTPEIAERAALRKGVRPIRVAVHLKEV